MTLHVKCTAVLATAISGLIFSSPSSAFTQNATLGEAFINAEATAQARDYSPLLAIDGSYSGTSRWQARENNAISFDVGTNVEMEGLYVWMLASSSRNHWIRVESSQDGESWISQWHAIATPKNANSKPVFLPIVTDDRNARYIRITGFGNSTNNWNYITEVRWLAAGNSVSSNKHVKQAAWFDKRAENTNLSNLAYYAPQLTSWSDRATNLLSAASFNAFSNLDKQCPLNGLSIFNPQVAVSDVTGEMSQFVTSKILPDGSSVWAIDWDHVELTIPTNWNGSEDTLSAPEKLDVVYDQWITKYFANGSTAGNIMTFNQCGEASERDVVKSDFKHAFFAYLKNQEDGSFASEISQNWNQPVTISKDAPNDFNQSVSIGTAFTKKVIDTVGESLTKANDGFIDSGSRWSSNSIYSPTVLELSVGPAVTNKAKARGLYIWMHRSDQRTSKVSIYTREDGELWSNVAEELTLPIVPVDTPVYIALENSDSLEFKHILIRGLGSGGTTWTSVAEVRYSDSETPDARAIIVSPNGPRIHAQKGYAFDKALTYTTGTSHNFASMMIDGSIAPLNYWATKGQSTVTFALVSPQTMSSINLWMHRSSQRSSDITVRVYKIVGTSWEAESFDLTVPVSPNEEATKITFPETVGAFQVDIDFNGNSNNDWNSITEVSWE